MSVLTESTPRRGRRKSLPEDAVHVGARVPKGCAQALALLGGGSVTDGLQIAVALAQSFGTLPGGYPAAIFAARERGVSIPDRVLDRLEKMCSSGQVEETPPHLDFG